MSQSDDGSGGRTKQHWDQNLISVLALGSAVEAARSTGLLVALDESPGTAEDLASRLKLNERATARVLDVLVAAGVLDKSETDSPSLAEYRPSLAFTTFSKFAPGGFPAALSLFGHTEELLRTGDPFTQMDANRGASYSGVVRALGRLFQDAAVQLATTLELRPKRILDVGCGAGVWSLAIAERAPEAHAVGLDLPEVVNAFATSAAEMGLEDRVTLLPGDMYSVALPDKGFDLVVVANVLRLETEEKARQLVLRVAGALQPGGCFLVVDALSSGTIEREMARAAYALHLTLRTRTGTVHSPKRIRSWLYEAGVGDVREVSCGPALGAVSGLVGRRDAG